MAWFNRAKARGTRPELPAASPGSSIYPGVGQWGDISLPNPSATTVAGLPAANRARLLISNAIAQMSPMVMWGPDGFVSENTPNILKRPNSNFGCFDFFQMACDTAVVRGNFVGILADFDANGYAQQIVPVAPGFFLAYIDGAGYTVYSVSGYPDLLSRDQVVHIRANSSPQQPMGIGVVSQFRRSLGQALDQQNFAADTYRSGSVPSGIIELDLPEVDKAQADAVQTQWLTNHAGSQAPAVLPNTMKFTPISWTPEDMQFLQAREFTIGEMAHMFNMDPTDLGAAMQGASMTYANIEQRQIQRTVDTYAPWMRRFEEEWSDLIPGGNTAKLCPDNLLRTDSKTRAEVQQLEIGNGVLNVDEARKIHGKKPLPKPPKATPATQGAPAGPVDASGEPFSSAPIPGTDLMVKPVTVKD